MSLEARRATRFPVRLACHVSSPLRGLEDLPGVTLNMSRNGLLATFTEDGSPSFAPEVGGPVCVIVELPGALGSPRRCLECRGHVVRVEQRPTSFQIAFELERLEFCDLPGGPSAEGSGSYRIQ